MSRSLRFPVARWNAWAVALAMAAVLSCPATAASQHILEARGAHTEYRFVDWNYTWKSGAVVDVFYVGVPGSNEFNLGGGFGYKAGNLLLAPLVYGVIGVEDSQRGVKIALLAAYERGGWKLVSFLGHYAHVSGEVPSYQVLDTLDITRKLGGRWELGVQAGFFHVDGEWNEQIGPIVKVNDRLGAWAVSYRFGPQREFRVGRVLAF